MTIPAPRSVPISVLVPVKNENRNIVECLRSVEFAAEVVVVDSGSTDGTIALAEGMGARVVQFAWDGNFPKKKNWALENVDWKHEWVLILDADERILPELAAEIARVIADPKADGFYINRRFIFLGGWIRHCGYYPSWNLRLFRHSKGRYERLESVGDTGSGDNEVHEHIVLDGSSAYLRHDMLHEAYPDVYTWMEKHNRYSNWEARVALSDAGNAGLKASPFGGPLERRRWLKRIATRLPCRPVLRFVYHYILKRGFLDGYRGFLFCRLLAIYEFLSVAKQAEIRFKGQSEKR